MSVSDVFFPVRPGTGVWTEQSDKAAERRGGEESKGEDEEKERERQRIEFSTHARAQF